MPKVTTIPGSTYRGLTGVFADNPAMTPKQAINRGPRDAEHRDSMARIFLSIAEESDNSKAEFLNTAGLEGGSSVRNIAELLSGYTGYMDFLLQNVSESLQEKVNTNEVLSDNYVAYFFGQAPPVFTFQGTLINSYQDDQRLGMHLAYQNLLRGTQLARRKALVRIRYDSVIVSGALLSMSQSITAGMELAIPFSFQLLVKSFFIFEEPSIIQAKVSTPFNPAGVAFIDKVGAPSTIRVKTLIIPPAQPLSKEPVIGAISSTTSTNLSGRVDTQKTDLTTTSSGPILPTKDK